MCDSSLSAYADAVVVAAEAGLRDRSETNGVSAPLARAPPVGTLDSEKSHSEREPVFGTVEIATPEISIRDFGMRLRSDNVCSPRTRFSSNWVALHEVFA